MSEPDTGTDTPRDPPGWIWDLVAMAGAGLLLYGLGEIYRPLAFLAAGAGLVFFALVASGALAAMTSKDDSE